MHNLPVISGEKLLKVLKKQGYVILRQAGSHIRLEKDFKTHKHKITIPYHKVIAFGTLHDIIRSICEKNSLTKEQMLDLLK